MKSIKEKAKAYDEAIKRAQAKMEEAKVFDYDDEQTAHTIRLTTTDIFPELKESEDEKIRKGIIRNLEYLMDRAEGFVKDELKERIAWLEAQGEQKPADTEKGAKGNDREIPNSAWTEEDREMRMKVLKYLSTRCNVYEYEEVECWLKSLKERYTWKPSNEQMDVLNEVIRNPYLSTAEYNGLVALREQLKAL